MLDGNPHAGVLLPPAGTQQQRQQQQQLGSRQSSNPRRTCGSCSSCSAAKDSWRDPSSLRACRFTAACTRFSFFCGAEAGANKRHATQLTGRGGGAPRLARRRAPASPEVPVTSTPASSNTKQRACFFFLLEVVPLWKAEYMSSRDGPLTAVLPSSPPSSSLSAGRVCRERSAGDQGRGRDVQACGAQGNQQPEPRQRHAAKEAGSLRLLLLHCRRARRAQRAQQERLPSRPAC